MTIADDIFNPKPEEEEESVKDSLKKVVCICLGWVLLIFWTASFSVLMCDPSLLSRVVKNSNTLIVTVVAALCLFSIVMNILLVIGINLEKRLYLKTYLFLVLFFILLLGIIVIVHCNVGSQSFKARTRYFAVVVGVFKINALTFYVVRRYYVKTYCNEDNDLCV